MKGLTQLAPSWSRPQRLCPLLPLPLISRSCGVARASLGQSQARDVAWTAGFKRACVQKVPSQGSFGLSHFVLGPLTCDRRVLEAPPLCPQMVNGVEGEACLRAQAILNTQPRHFYACHLPSHVPALQSGPVDFSGICETRENMVGLGFSSQVVLMTGPPSP